MDAIIAFVPKDAGAVRIKYNQGHVAIATTGTNFAWFMLRKGEHVFCQVTTGEEARDQFVAQLEEKGIDCGATRWSSTLKMSLKIKELENENNRDLVRSVLAKAEKFSRE